MVSPPVAASNLADLNPVVCATNAAISSRRERENAGASGRFEESPSREFVCQLVCHIVSSI
jgi:hypothetical protein